MKRWKRWAAAVLALAVWAAVLSGCAKDEEGVSLAVCLGSELASLDPIYATAEGDQTVLTHLYENLMRVTVDVSGGATVTNGMAKSYSWQDNLDGTITWTFRLRGAKWSDGRAVKEEDFVYAWRRLADPASGSPYASILSIVAGYDQVRATGDTSLLQVSARNDSTLDVVLTGDYEWFLTEVCTSPATSPLREDVVVRLRDAAVERNKAAEAETGTAGTEKWWSQTEKLVTNGPYQLSAYEPGESLRLTDFPKYYGSHAGPTELVFRFADTAEEAQALYDGGEVDLVWPLADEAVAELAAERLQKQYPGLKIAGTHDGYFKEDAPVAAAIRESGADCVFVCLGAPKQELWMAKNGPATGAHLLCGLGGSLDVFAGTVERAPKFWSDHGLEWFYRLCKEPKRIGRMMKLPLFLVHVRQEKGKRK